MGIHALPDCIKSLLSKVLGCKQCSIYSFHFITYWFPFLPFPFALSFSLSFVFLFLLYFFLVEKTAMYKSVVLEIFMSF